MILVGSISMVSATLTEDLKSGLVAYYKLDDNSGTSATDATGNSHTGILKNGATWVIGKLNKAVRMDGVNQYINISDADDLDIGVNNNFTVCAWVNMTSSSGNTEGIVMKYDNTGFYGWQLRKQADDTIMFIIRDTSANEISVTSASALPTNTWWFVCGVRDVLADKVYVYVNGTGTSETDTTTAGMANLDAVVIGRTQWSADYFTGVIDEVGIWNRSLSVSNITAIYNSGDGEPYDDLTNIYVTLNNPIDGSVSSSTNITFNSSYSSIGTSLDNVTLWIWETDGTIFNNTAFSTIPGDVNKTNILIDGFVLGNYKWNALACGQNTTSTICSFAPTNYTFDIGAITVGEYYNSQTYETATENFQINISMFAGTSLISAYLWYNGTSYSVSDISTSSNQKVLKKTIDIPVNQFLYQNETKNFHWSFVFSNSGLTPQNTTIRQQNVSFINLQICNVTYFNTAVNFTTKDEENPNPIVNSSFHSNWYYWIGNGNIKKNYSFENTSIMSSSFQFCIYPQYKLFNVDTDIEYSAPGFPERTRYLRGAVLSNSTQEVDLFLLNSTDSVKFFFTVTQSMTPISDAIVTITKYDVGVGEWITVGIRKSDTIGKFIEYLDLDKEYKFSITKNGQFLGIIDKTATCSATPCEIALELTTATTNLWSGYYDIYATNVAYNLSYNSITKNITFTFVDLTGLAQYFRLQVNQISYNQTGAIVCNLTSYSTAGTLVCGLSSYSGNFRADAFISRSPEKWVDTLFAIIAAIKEVIGKEGLFFTLVVVVVVGLIGAWNPVVGILLAALAMFFSFAMGFIAISYTAIVLIFILAIFMIIKMGKGGGV